MSKINVCTVKTHGQCVGAKCVLNGVCPFQQAILESLKEEEQK